jgi:hypothetical protein
MTNDIKPQSFPSFKDDCLGSLYYADLLLMLNEYSLALDLTHRHLVILNQQQTCRGLYRPSCVVSQFVALSVLLLCCVLYRA